MPKEQKGRKIKIFDTTLRDGEQSPGASLNIQEKLLIAKQLAKLKVDIIEAGFPIASEGDFEAVRLIAQKVKGPIICALARCTRKDIDRAWEAVKYSKKPRIHIFLATSQVHIEKKLRKSKEEIIRMVIDSVKYAKKFCDEVEYSPEDASRTSSDYMCDVVRAAIKAGATTINIPDTVGYAEPQEFGNRIKYLQQKVPESKKITISIHCHNDLGLAVANSLEAVRNGATQIECTINGLGERAGNCSLEEVVMNIKTRKEFFKCHTNINAKEIFKTSRMVADFTGIAVQRNKAIVGRNAFAHEAGIHQHGVISDKKTYEIMCAEEVGWVGENLVIGKHSGKHAVETVLRERGYELNRTQISEVLKKVKDLADKQKEVQREDVIAIANDVTSKLSKEEEIVKLDELSVITGNKITPSATVGLVISGEKKIGTGTGVGPVDAVSNAIANIMGPSIKLKEYGLKAITGGTDALADVAIKLEDKNKNIFMSQAVNEDVIMASALALIQGINKVLNFQKSKKGRKK